MKDTLNERKSISEGINRRVDEAENQISDLNYKEAENTQSEKTKIKKEYKKMRIVQRAFGIALSIPTLTSWGCQKEKREIKEFKIYVKK